jgi:hypothetical protein
VTVCDGLNETVGFLSEDSIHNMKILLCLHLFAFCMEFVFIVRIKGLSSLVSSDVGRHSGFHGTKNQLTSTRQRNLMWKSCYFRSLLQFLKAVSFLDDSLTLSISYCPTRVKDIHDVYWTKN